ncbi:MAG TPA: class I SAM-dependent methyltransferase, partial [Candidatus Dormibacteraeota bacterium]|nr:class I SAM-dependent methyltransferase [Candidatus Dormibacteraeota bacterium]
GTNYRAPIGRPHRVLDVGSGTGQWAFDLCAEFPEALVVGLDMVVSKPERPAGYRFVRTNALQGLPFAAGVFDFAHQRFLTAGIPVASWPPLMQEMARVARPGGWIELVEGAPMIEPAGPATTRLIELGRRLGSSLGLDTRGAIYGSLAEQLHAAGLTHVTTRHVDLPIGEWGGRIGSFMASDLRASFTRLTAVYQARLGLSAEECSELLTAMQVEWTELETTLRIGYAFGRKPY